jgi:hypothetical protein
MCTRRLRMRLAVNKTEVYNMQIPTSRFLRLVLFADAATCFATGLLMSFGSTLLAQFLGMQPELLHYAGISLLPFTAFLVYMTSRERLSSAAVWTVIVLNALWTIDSFLIVATGWVTPNELGYVFVGAQALGVAMFAGLEYVALKKSVTVGIS